MPQSDSKSFYAEAHNTQLLMQDISTQVRSIGSIYRYIYWSDCQLHRAILNRFPDSDDILLCICCGVARVKCLLWFRLTWSRQIVTRDTVTSWHLVTTPSHQRRVVIIISEQSGPGPGHSPRIALLPPWSLDISDCTMYIIKKLLWFFRKYFYEICYI